MNSTVITIGIGEALTIVVPVILALIGGFFTVWRASANAHEKIIGRLSNVETQMTTVQTDVSTLKSDVSILKSDVSTLTTDMAVAKNDLDWLKHHARTGQPPSDKE